MARVFARLSRRRRSSSARTLATRKRLRSDAHWRLDDAACRCAAAYCRRLRSARLRRRASRLVSAMANAGARATEHFFFVFSIRRSQFQSQNHNMEAFINMNFAVFDSYNLLAFLNDLQVSKNVHVSRCNEQNSAHFSSLHFVG